MTSTLPTDRPDTTDMVIVHGIFRRLFGDLPGLVRGVRPGDTGRAATVAGFAVELADALESHHTGEDELLWPVLLPRVTPDPSAVLRAEEQHERVHVLLVRTREQAPVFGANADIAARDALATTLADLYEILCVHLAEEERDILPLAEQHMTKAEWDRLGEHGRAGIPKSRLLIQLGWILDGLPKDEQRRMLADMPRAARVAWRLIGRRKFAAEKLRIYGAP